MRNVTLSNLAEPGVRTLIQDRITDVIAAFDNHDPGILDGEYKCRCGWRGTEKEWEQHLAGAIGDALVTETVELPEQMEIPA